MILELIFSPYIIIPALITRVILKLLLNFRLEVVVGTLIYGIVLVILRICRGVGSGLYSLYHLSRDSEPIAKPRIAERVSDLNSVYRMNELKVILGFTTQRQAIRVDLDKYHTLIAGTTGSGKTNILNSIICQLVGRNGRFFNDWDIYVIDLKGFEEDHLSKWQPVLTGYYSIGDDGTTQEAIEAVLSICDRIKQGKSGKRTIVIIDELSMLTNQAPTPALKRYGEAALNRLSSQLRSRGALVCATQRPVFDVVARGVSSNLERKICLRVDDNKDSARLILRHPPKNDATKLRTGEYLLKEPGHRNSEQIGRAMLMNLPGEIDLTVYNVLSVSAENDERLKLFADIASQLKVGAAVPGVQKARGNGWTLPTIQDAYWNYVEAGAMVNSKVSSKDGRPTQRQLACEYGEAFAKVNRYIRAGMWRASPRNGNGAVSDEDNTEHR